MIPDLSNLQLGGLFFQPPFHPRHVEFILNKTLNQAVYLDSEGIAGAIFAFG